jgi:hypothetical protein
MLQFLSVLLSRLVLTTDGRHLPICALGRARGSPYFNYESMSICWNGSELSASAGRRHEIKDQRVRPNFDVKESKMLKSQQPCVPRMLRRAKNDKYEQGQSMINNSMIVYSIQSDRQFGYQHFQGRTRGRKLGTQKRMIWETGESCLRCSSP